MDAVGAGIGGGRAAHHPLFFVITQSIKQARSWRRPPAPPRPRCASAQVSRPGPPLFGLAFNLGKKFGDRAIVRPSLKTTRGGGKLGAGEKAPPPHTHRRVLSAEWDNNTAPAMLLLLLEEGKFRRPKGPEPRRARQRQSKDSEVIRRQPPPAWLAGWLAQKG